MSSYHSEQMSSDRTMLGKFAEVYWHQPLKADGAKRPKKKKRLITPELNKEFTKGTYAQKQNLGQQQEGGT